MDINAPLLPHMAQYGKYCQAASNAHALYNLGNTRLVGQAQCDMFFVLDNGTVLQSAREGDAAITGGFVGRARARGYDEEDDVEAVKAMLVDPANSVDGREVRCIADPTEVDENGYAPGFIKGAENHRATYVSPSDVVRAAADAHRAELVMIRDLAIENGTADLDWVGRVIILEGDRVGGVGGQGGVLLGGKPFGAKETFGDGDGERLYDSTKALGKILAGKGADVLNATLPGFDYEKELGTSKSSKVIPHGVVMIVSNGYTPLGRLHDRMQQFRDASNRDTDEPLLYRESVLVDAMRNYDGDLSFEGHKLHSVFEWDEEQLVEREDTGAQTRRPGWALRALGPNGEKYGVPAPAAPRLPRAAPPAPAPAPAPVTNDPLGEYTDDKVPPAVDRNTTVLIELYCKRFNVSKAPRTPSLYAGTRVQWLRERIREGAQ